MKVETRAAGEHTICREAEDLFVYRFPKGAATGAHVAELSALERRAWAEGLAYAYNVTVLGDDLSISPGALTETARLYQQSPPRSTAFVARRFFLRTSMEFLTRMLRAVGVKMEARIFADEVSARAWIEERRATRTRAKARISSPPAHHLADHGFR